MPGEEPDIFERVASLLFWGAACLAGAAWLCKRLWLVVHRAVELLFEVEDGTVEIEADAGETGTEEE